MIPEQVGCIPASGIFESTGGGDRGPYLEKCELSTGQPRTDPHRDLRVLAKD
jgi:hypothetical protein